MNNFKKLLSFIIILFLIIFTSGYYNSLNSIDNLAYVISLGLDISETNKIKLSVQIALPNKNTSSSGKSSDSSTEKSSIINTVECSSIKSGINLLNSSISKKLNLSHCKIIVISEKLSKQGITKYIDDLFNDIEIRPTCNVIISKCPSELFLNNSKPELEELVSKYYEIIPKSSQYTGYTDNITIGEFYYKIKSNTSETYTILGNIVTDQNSNSENNNIAQENSNQLSDTLSKSNNKVETIGLAVFKNDTLVGELNAIQTISHLILTNNFKEFNISIANPFDSTSNINITLSRKRRTKNKVYLVNNTPFIQSDISLTAHLKSYAKENLSTNDIKTIEEYINSYLTSYVYQYLYLTAKDFKTDTIGFGKDLIRQYKTNPEWDNYNWLTKYKDSFFKVNIQTELLNTYTISK